MTDPVLNDWAAEYTPGISESRAGASSFYHFDRLGTMAAITNSSASVTDTRQYDAFGMPVASSGTNPTPFGFVGRQGYQSDPDTGLMLLGHRYYDPSTGRFLTRDPAKDGRNWYDYCGNGPLRSIDPSGLLDWSRILTDAAIGVGVGTLTIIAIAALPVTAPTAAAVVIAGLGGGVGGVFGYANVHYQTHNDVDWNPGDFNNELVVGGIEGFLVGDGLFFVAPFFAPVPAATPESPWL